MASSNTYISFNRKREERKYFMSENFLVYCCDTPNFLAKIGIESYNENNRFLFVVNHQKRLNAYL